MLCSRRLRGRTAPVTITLHRVSVDGRADVARDSEVAIAGVSSDGRADVAERPTTCRTRTTHEFKGLPEFAGSTGASTQSAVRRSPAGHLDVRFDEISMTSPPSGPSPSPSRSVSALPSVRASARSPLVAASPTSPESTRNARTRGVSIAPQSREGSRSVASPSRNPSEEARSRRGLRILNPLVDGSSPS